MSVKEGALIAVVGTVGAGKSSLLSALLGEMEKVWKTKMKKWYIVLNFGKTFEWKGKEKIKEICKKWKKRREEKRRERREREKKDKTLIVFVFSIHMKETVRWIELREERGKRKWDRIKPTKKCFSSKPFQESGFVNTRGSVAYVPQQAWIQNASVQVNIWRYFAKLFNSNLKSNKP